MKWIVLTALCFVFSCLAVPAPQADELQQKLDPVLEKFVELDQFSGNVLVARDGNVLYARAFGEADKDHHVKNTLDTKFNIGSIGKTFTAISILQLVEQGKLQVTDPVINHLPNFPFGDKITIHHLLTHTSGTFNYFAHPDFPLKFYQIRSVSDALPLIYDQELQFDTPGEQFAYSNSGIIILGAVIEKISGQEYAQYIKKHILDPAGMKDTGIHYLDQIIENRASGYHKSPTGQIKRNIYMVPPANADGGLETTVKDFLKYDRALYSETLISESSKQKMFTSFRDNYGYCMEIEKRFGNTIVGHGGGAPGVSASFYRYLDDKYVIIVLSNYSGGASTVPKVIEAILFNQPYEEPKLHVSEFMYQQMIQIGVDQTIENAQQILAANGYVVTSQYVLNGLGYELLSERKIDMAIGIFKLNTELYPDEANPYDSLGDAYAAQGDTQKAIRCYKKALERDPTIEITLKKFEKLSKSMQ
jgi:CubicO group peptidase (beta-lactamase class C family)